MLKYKGSPSLPFIITIEQMLNLPSMYFPTGTYIGEPIVFQGVNNAIIDSHVYVIFIIGEGVAIQVDFAIFPLFNRTSTNDEEIKYMKSQGA